VKPAGPDLATLDAGALEGRIEVRTWRDGDRLRPLGMKGTKSLQDLFTDRGVPRSLRGRVPVVTVDGEIAWVAGVAVSEEFRLAADSEQVAVLTAQPIE
jgi:tRNA(Ile)-lysidine synthase